MGALFKITKLVNMPCSAICASCRRLASRILFAPENYLLLTIMSAINPAGFLVCRFLSKTLAFWADYKPLVWL